MCTLKPLTEEATQTEAGELLGGRLPLLSALALDEAQRQLYDRLFAAKTREAAAGGFLATTEQGELIGPFNSYLFIPEIATGYLAWVDALHQSLPFEREVSETAILTIGVHWNAVFEIYAHTAAARKAELPEAGIQSLLAGEEPAQLSERAQIVWRFTRSLIVTHEVGEDVYRAAREAFGDSGLVALVHLIGLYLSVSAVLTAFRIPSPKTTIRTVTPTS